MAAQWRGSESLDEVNPAMVAQLLREETARWREISSTHLQLSWDAVDRFVHLALKHCVPPRLLRYLKKFVVNDRMERLRYHADEKLEELLRCHGGTNPAFHDFVCELNNDALELGAGMRENLGTELVGQLNSIFPLETVEEFLKLLGNSAGSITPWKTQIAEVLFKEARKRIGDAASAAIAQDTPEISARQKFEQEAVRRAISIAEKYYKVSLISFVSYANALVVQSYLLERLPYEVFTFEIISSQSSETVSEIAGEKDDDVKKRAECERNLGILRAAMQCFKDFRHDLS
ncbi:uncharacterized protein ColSpa_10134 [Colletotrichum spaethianum]|uniref:GED domain-containing protein n=1 Tax=Colletotrichum spaethianum TaxID=700344 RepID=A0AA37USJ2_9PEZI|nr:uncharacterized protein ColSpa_10134 [Colletotrichum spaethianum]GKT49953.1 hypothetical protein ColSpa_10134 [Colletotrichum spaethianum]